MNKTNNYKVQIALGPERKENETLTAYMMRCSSGQKHYERIMDETVAKVLAQDNLRILERWIARAEKA
jgi:hypothetical protein